MRFRHKAALAAAVCLGCASLNSVRAAPVLTDNFDSYSNGALLGQGGWTITGTSTTNAYQVAGGADKNVPFVGTGQDAFKAFTSSVPHTDGNSLITSFKINISAAQATADYFTHLSDPIATTTNFYERVFGVTSGTGFRLSLVDTSGTGSTPTLGNADLNFGQDYNVVITWNFVGGGTNNDTFTMTVNGTPYLSHAWTSATVEPANVSAFNLRQGQTGPTGTIDNINVESVPEPASVAMIGLIGAAGLMRRRQRA